MAEEHVNGQPSVTDVANKSNEMDYVTSDPSKPLCVDEQLGNESNVLDERTKDMNGEKLVNDAIDVVSNPSETNINKDLNDIVTHINDVMDISKTDSSDINQLNEIQSNKKIVINDSGITFDDENNVNKGGESKADIIMENDASGDAAIITKDIVGSEANIIENVDVQGDGISTFDSNELESEEEDLIVPVTEEPMLAVSSEAANIDFLKSKNEVATADISDVIDDKHTNVREEEVTAVVMDTVSSTPNRIKKLDSLTESFINISFDDVSESNKDTHSAASTYNDTNSANTPTEAVVDVGKSVDGITSNVESKNLNCEDDRAKDDTNIAPLPTSDESNVKVNNPPVDVTVKVAADIESVTGESRNDTLVSEGDIPDISNKVSKGDSTLAELEKDDTNNIAPPIPPVVMDAKETPNVDTANKNETTKTYLSEMGSIDNSDLETIEPKVAVEGNSISRATTQEMEGRSDVITPIVGVETHLTAPVVEEKADATTMIEGKSDVIAPMVEVKSDVTPARVEGKSDDTTLVAEKSDVIIPTVEVKSHNAAPAVEVRSDDLIPEVEVKSDVTKPVVEVKSDVTTPDVKVKSDDPAITPEVKSDDITTKEQGNTNIATSVVEEKSVTPGTEGAGDTAAPVTVEAVNVAASEPENEWLDILGNGLLKKKIMKKGLGRESRPVAGNLVSVRCEGKLENGTIVDKSHQLQFILSDEDVIQAFDLAVALMEDKEVATVYTDARYAYGIYGRPDYLPPIPQNASITYEVEVLSVEEGPCLTEMSSQDRVLYGDKKRIRGNDLYARGDFAGSINAYKRGIKYLEGTDDKIVIDMKIKCLNNLSAAQLKVKAYRMAIHSLDTVLHHEPENVKALFRKGKCLDGLEKEEEAMECIKKASMLDPQNKMILQELGRLRSRVAVTHQKEKEMYQRMFQSNKEEELLKEEEKALNWSLTVTATVVGMLGVVAGWLWYKHR